MAWKASEIESFVVKWRDFNTRASTRLVPPPPKVPMIVLSRRPLALLICCLFAGVPVVHAAPATADPATGMRLERRFNLLAREKEKKEKNEKKMQKMDKKLTFFRFLRRNE